MDKFFYFYITTWATACLVALIVMLIDRHNLVLIRKNYWRFLFQGWKVCTFFIASSGLVIVAPYTGDPTWDYVDAAFMSILTFITAPWVIGVIYRSLHRQSSFPQLYAAICVWLFSASWSYDLYLLFRDGAYPVTWETNLVASSFLYICAGFLWNLELKPGRGVIFGFMAPEWPAVYDSRFFSHIFWYALPFMMMAGASIVVFLL